MTNKMNILGLEFTVPQQLQHIRAQCEQMCTQERGYTAGRILGWGVAHAVSGRLYSAINPLTGGLFGVAFGLTQNAFHWAWDKYMPVHNPCTTTAKWALGYFSGLGIATLAANVTGAALSIKAAVILHLSTLGLITGGAISIVIIAAVVIAAGVGIEMNLRGEKDPMQALTRLVQDIDPYSSKIGLSEENIGKAIVAGLELLEVVVDFMQDKYESLKIEIPAIIKEPTLLFKSYEVPDDADEI